MFHGHAAAVRCRRPLVQLGGHLEHSAIRNMEMLFGIQSAVTPGQKSWVISAELRSKALRLAHLLFGSISYSFTSVYLT